MFPFILQNYSIKFPSVQVSVLLLTPKPLGVCVGLLRFVKRTVLKVIKTSKGHLAIKMKSHCWRLLHKNKM